MPDQYSSGFSAAVGELLKNFTAMRGLKMAERESKQRERESRQVGLLRQAELSDRGYSELPMPKVERPPAQTWEQRVGRSIQDFFTGGPAEPGTFLFKDHPSVREAEIAGARQAHDLDREDDQAHDLLLEGVRAANRQKKQEREGQQRMREIGASGTNQLAVARAQKEPSALQVRAARESEVEAGVERAVAAANGNPQIAHAMYHASNPGRNVSGEYFLAAAQRFSERKAVQAEADRQSRQEIASKRRSGSTALDKLNAMAAAQGMPPINFGSDGDPYAEQRNDYDRAAAAARAQGKDPQALLGPRPPEPASARAITQGEYRQLRAQGFTDQQIRAAGYTVRDR